LYLKPGKRVAIGHFEYVVIDSRNPADVMAKCLLNNHIYPINMLNANNSGYLLPAIGTRNPNGSLPPTNPFSPGDSNYQRACRRYEMIAPFLLLDKIPTHRKHEVAVSAGVVDKTVGRWFKKGKDGGFEALITPPTFGGYHGTRTDKLAESKLKEWIASRYLSDARVREQTVTASYKDYKNECWERGIKKVPKYITFKRRLEEVDKRLDAEDNYGKNPTDGLSFPSIVNISDLGHPLQSVQIDHHLCDIILIDERTKEPIGRPWLTVGVDVYSRCIWGYYLGYAAPKATRVAMTIMNGCFNKHNIENLFHLSDWPVFGIPDRIHTDNGKDLRARGNEQGCRANGIQNIRSPVQTPEDRGIGERWFGTLEDQLIHTLPGTTFSNPQKKGDYDAEKEACLTIPEFEKLLLEWIVNEYLLTHHEGIGMKPIEKWNKGLDGKERGYPITPREPDDIIKFREDFLPFVDGDGKRKIGKDGVHSNGRSYWDDYLYELLASNGPDKRYPIRRNPFDARFVYLYHEESDRPVILMAGPEKISAKEVKAARRESAANGLADPDEYTITENVHKRRKLIELRADKSKKARKVLASDRWEQETEERLNLPSPPVSKGSQPQTPEVESEEEELDWSPHFFDQSMRK